MSTITFHVSCVTQHCTKQPIVHPHHPPVHDRSPTFVRHSPTAQSNCTIFKANGQQDGPSQVLLLVLLQTHATDHVPLPTPHHPPQKSCNRCQWQCLTDASCVSASLNGTSYTPAQLSTFNCGDGYFTLPRNGTISGLCVLLGANGTIIDTQEQGCQECVQQCFLYVGEELGTGCMSGGCLWEWVAVVLVGGARA